MTIGEIYDYFGVPPNLQEHMIRVAKIIVYIREVWNGSDVDWDNLIRAGLLHDLGNIVRFKFDSHPEIYGKEANRLDYWRNKQQEIIAKYGADDHEATRNMLREVKADPKITDWILSKSFANAKEIADSGKWEDKLLLYADMRVLPMRIGTMRERMDELQSRRKDLDPQTMASRIGACEELETQIQKHVTVPLSRITEEEIEKIDIEKWMN